MKGRSYINGVGQMIINTIIQDKENVGKKEVQVYENNIHIVFT